MDRSKLYESLHPEKLRLWLDTAFHEAGIKSIEFLSDDRLVEKAAHIAYGKIPLLPFRAAIKAVIGEKGFVNLVFKIREKMIQTNSLSLSWLNMDFIKSALQNLIARKEN